MWTNLNCFECAGYRVFTFYLSAHSKKFKTVQVLCENCVLAWEFVPDLLPFLIWSVWLPLHCYNDLVICKDSNNCLFMDNVIGYSHVPNYQY